MSPRVTALSSILLLALAIPGVAQAAWPHDPTVNVPLGIAVGFQGYTAQVSDGSGGSIIAWVDGRSDAAGDVYIQRVNAWGVPQWTANGVALCNVIGEQNWPTIVSDGAGGAIVAWMDFRNTLNFDTYVQRVNGAGSPQWTANGVGLTPMSPAISNTPPSPPTARVAPSSHGGIPGMGTTTSSLSG